MKVMVQFPDGPKQVEAIVMGKSLLGKGSEPSMLLIPRRVPGFAVSRSDRGWEASPGN